MDTITGVARIFQQGGGAKRGSEATQWAEGVRDIFENSCIKMNFLHINFSSSSICFTLRSTRGGGMAHCALLSYANDSGVARIFQRGPKRGRKETEQGEGVDGREMF